MLEALLCALNADISPPYTQYVEYMVAQQSGENLRSDKSS
jgi:hypothetical protein